MKSHLHLNSLFLLIFLFFMSAGKSQTVVDLIVNSPAHDTLEAAVIAAGLADDLSGEGPFTVFAPTDDAFKALPEGLLETLLQDPAGALANILLYHVVGGKVMSTDLSDGQTATTLLGRDITVTINEDGVYINNAKVTVADLVADNGVVHVIDAVLVPPAITVVDIIASSPAHDTLEAAVIAAGLADDLSGEGPFTVFAPTDDAFKALPEGTLETLLQDPTGDLANILLYHVVSGKVMSTDLSDGQTATTLLGKDITVTINEDGVYINNAKVVVADLEADNGVVHVLDAVLIPSSATGLFDLKGQSLELGIHPNPSSDYVRLSGLKNAVKGKLRIISMRGEIVQNTYLEDVSQPVNISSLQKGGYFMILESAEGRFTGKLIVR